jgi:hypothetical protein
MQLCLGRLAFLRVECIRAHIAPSATAAQRRGAGPASWILEGVIGRSRPAALAHSQPGRPLP